MLAFNALLEKEPWIKGFKENQWKIKLEKIIKREIEK